jgi:hypothetical protein
MSATTLEDIRSVPGLDEYLDALEERLARTVATHPGLVAAVGNEALAAGGKRLRPALVFLSTPPERDPSLAAGVAVELVHMATLVHDDLIDRAHFRRGKAAAWSVYGPAAARATGDYLFARAFAELSATGDAAAVEILADTTLCLARGEALQRTQTRDPATTVEAYLERCALKTGKLFEAACRRVRPRARHRLPDRGRRPRLLRRDDRNRQDRGHRSPRRDTDAAAPPCGAAGCGRARRASGRTAGGRARARRRDRSARRGPPCGTGLR